MSLLALTVSHLAFAASADADPHGVVSSVQSHNAQLSHCYGEALQDDPWAGGVATARLQVGQTGFVESASIEASPLSPSANDCVIGVLKSVTFPALVGTGATIVVPFDFSAS